MCLGDMGMYGLAILSVVSASWKALYKGIKDRNRKSKSVMARVEGTAKMNMHLDDLEAMTS